MATRQEQIAAELRRRQITAELERRASLTKSTQDVAAPKATSSFGAPAIMGPEDVFFGPPGGASDQMWEQFHQAGGMQDFGGMILGGVGGVGGFALGGPPGSFAVGAVGSTIGEMLGRESDLRALGQPVTWYDREQAAKRGFMSDVAGQLGGHVIGKVFAGGLWRGRQLPGIRQINEKLSKVATQLPDTGKISPGLLEAARKGHSFAPISQGMDAPGAARMESFIRSSYFGGSRLRDLSKINPQVYRQITRDLAGEFWDEAGQELGEEGVSRVFLDAVSGKRDRLTRMFADKMTRGLTAIPDSQISSQTKTALKTFRSPQGWRQVGKQKYQLVDDLVEQTIRPVTFTEDVTSSILDATGKPLVRPVTRQTTAVVNISPITRVGQELKAIGEAGKGIGDAPKLVALGEKLMSDPTQVTFGDAEKLRSILESNLRRLKDPLGYKNDRIAKALTDASRIIDQAETVAAGGPGSPIRTALDDARLYWARYKTIERDPFVQRLAQLADADKPDQLMRHLFSADSVQQIQRAKTVLGEQTFDSLRDRYTSQMVDEALKSRGSIGATMRKQITRMNPDVLNELYGPAGLSEMLNVADMFQNIGAKSFENDIIQQAVRRAEQGHPDFIRKIFEKRNPQLARTIRRVVGEDNVKILRAAWLEDAIRTIGPKPSARFGRILDEMGDATLQAWFTPKHLESIRQVARIGEVLSQEGISMTNALAPLIEGGLLGGVAITPAKPGKLEAAAGVFGGLIGMGRILSNEKWAYWLAEGVKNPQRLQLISRRIAAEIVRQGIAPQTERREQPSVMPPMTTGYGARGF